MVADFTRLATIQDYQVAIGDQLKDLDVAVLILNAGVLFPGDLTDLSDQEVQDAIRCLNVQYFYVAKVMLDQLFNRFEKTGRKSGLMFVNSYFATQVGEANLCYCASKAATSSLA